MANERQFFRDINPGDVSIEGRKSNGVTADINGNTIIYAGIKQSELQKLNQEKYLGNVPIDGYTSTFIAALAPGQLPPYPAGNNNNETYFESKTTDPNKIIVANQQITPTPTPQPTITITPTPTSLPTTETTASKPAPNEDGGFIFLDEVAYDIEPVQLTGQFTVDLTLIYSNDTPVSTPTSNVPFTEVNLLDFKTLPSKISNSNSFKNFINQSGVKNKVESIAKNIGVTANDLYTIFYAESKFNPAIVNSVGATGLIQFMPRTARGLGTSGPALAKLTALQQLDFVEKYFIPRKGKYKNVYDLYLYTFFPLGLGKPQGWVIESKQHSAQIISQQNPAIARAAGKTAGTPLTIADFYKYVTNLLK